MIDAISCGGIVFHKGKVLLLYKNQSGRYMGWVMPKGTLEKGESFKETALREVKEETNVSAKIVKYIGKTQYNFKGSSDIINKTVYWYLMTSNSFYCKPQLEEYFSDVGYYKQHEAYHLLKFQDEKRIMKQAFFEYNELRRNRHSNDLIFKQEIQ